MKKELLMLQLIDLKMALLCCAIGSVSGSQTSVARLHTWLLCSILFGDFAGALGHVDYVDIIVDEVAKDAIVWNILIAVAELTIIGGVEGYAVAVLLDVEGEATTTINTIDDFFNRS